MALVVIPMASMVVMLVMTAFSVGVFSVSIMLMVSMMLFKATVTGGGLAFFIIPVTTVSRTFFVIPVITVSRTFFLVSMALVVLLFVSKPLSRFVFPIIGKCNTSAAKDYNDDNVKDVRRFHYFPPNGLQRMGNTSKILKAFEKLTLAPHYQRLISIYHDCIADQRLTGVKIQFKPALGIDL